MAAQHEQLTEHSPSVQAHLSILQSIIQRMASNSSSSKAWCITIVSAVLVISSQRDNPNFAFIAFFPAVLFLALDAYYLGLERAFRDTYNKFVRKLHTGDARALDLYDVSPPAKSFSHIVGAVTSFSIWGFYLSVLLLVMIARFVIFQEPTQPISPLTTPIP